MSPNPDILLLTANYPPEQTGIAPYTGALASGLARRGYRVAVTAAHPHYPEWAVRPGYGQYTRHDQIDGVMVSRRLHYVPRIPRGIRRLLSEITLGARLLFPGFRRPGVVVAVSPALFSTAMAVARIHLTPRRPPVVVWVQDIYTLGLSETGEGGNLSRKVTRWVEGATIRAADRVVVIHEGFADYVVKEFGVDPDRVTVVRNWTHLPPSEPVDRELARLFLGWPTDVTLAVHTGNMGVKQGLENILDAARLADQRREPVHFVLVGDGAERRRLVDLAAGISRLTFVEPLDEGEYRLALGAADVLVVNEKPGVSAMAVPSKLTAYFDAGRPVVAATDLDGITASEISASGAGAVVPAGEPGMLLNAVLALRADPAHAAALGANGVRYRHAVLADDTAIGQLERVIMSAASEGEGFKP